jgi:branched-chain amino acid transport system permease protein
MAVIATLGLASVLDGVMLVVFNSPQYSIDFPGLPTGSVSIGGARISSESLVLTAFTLVLSISVAVVLRLTPVGRRVRAAGQDPLLASQGGIHVRRLYLSSWAIASVLAGIAGIAYGTSNIVGTSMVDVALSAFPAILIGGLDSIEGAIVGGMLVGIFQGFVATYLQPKLLNVLTYGLLLVIMLVFPSGLFGTKRVARV